MSQTIEQLQQMVANLEAQLVDLYAERHQMPVPPQQAMAAISNLEEQIIALVDEKMEIQKTLEDQHQLMDKLKRKSKVLGAAMLEAALFDSPEFEGKKAA